MECPALCRCLCHHIAYVSGLHRTLWPMPHCYVRHAAAVRQVCWRPCRAGRACSERATGGPTSSVPWPRSGSTTWKVRAILTANGAHTYNPHGFLSSMQNAVLSTFGSSSHYPRVSILQYIQYSSGITQTRITTGPRSNSP